MNRIRVLFLSVASFVVSGLSAEVLYPPAVPVPFNSSGELLLNDGDLLLAYNLAGGQTGDSGNVHDGQAAVNGIPFVNADPADNNPEVQQGAVRFRLRGQEGPMSNVGTGNYSAAALDQLFGGAATSAFGDAGRTGLTLEFSGLTPGRRYRLQTLHRQGNQTIGRRMRMREGAEGGGVESAPFGPVRGPNGSITGVVQTAVWTAAASTQKFELRFDPPGDQKGRAVLNALVLHENPKESKPAPAAPVSRLWLPAIFGDHMVVQAEKPVRIWGKARPGEKITARFLPENGEAPEASVDGVAGEDRQWRIDLPPLPAGSRGALELLAPESGDRIIRDVLAGEVWLLSGQSNMRWTVAKSNNAEAEIADADHPGIRFFIADLNSASQPQDDLKGYWRVCSPETVGDFSAAGYFFGRELHQSLKVPVGLILSAVGGTPIQAWTPMDAMNAHPATEDLERDFEAYYAKPPAQRRRVRGTWMYGAHQQMGPARLYNGMIHPLNPFRVRGIAWCQGEANSRENGLWDGPGVYRDHFPLMIRSWREARGETDLPFFYIELANYMAPQQDPVDAAAEHNWADIREAQGFGLRLEAVYAVSAIDIGEADEIHYGDKQTAGKRLARGALGIVYGHGKGPWLSPQFRESVREVSRIRLRFDHADGLITSDGNAPRTFAIRGEGGDWRWAEAEIDGEDILVWHPEIPEPQAVRHAWAGNPDVNVYNAAGLPLSSFRTDRPEQGN